MTCEDRLKISKYDDVALVGRLVLSHTAVRGANEFNVLKILEYEIWYTVQYICMPIIIMLWLCYIIGGKTKSSEGDTQANNGQVQVTDPAIHYYYPHAPTEHNATRIH